MRTSSMANSVARKPRTELQPCGVVPQPLLAAAEVRRHPLADMNFW
jgi:hypothetical protein